MTLKITFAFIFFLKQKKHKYYFSTYLCLFQYIRHHAMMIIKLNQPFIVHKLGQGRCNFMHHCYKEAILWHKVRINEIDYYPTYAMSYCLDICYLRITPSVYNILKLIVLVFLQGIRIFMPGYNFPVFHRKKKKKNFLLLQLGSDYLMANSQTFYQGLYILLFSAITNSGE